MGVTAVMVPDGLTAVDATFGCEMYLMYPAPEAVTVRVPSNDASPMFTLTMFPVCRL